MNESNGRWLSGFVTYWVLVLGLVAAGFAPGKYWWGLSNYAFVDSVWMYVLLAVTVVTGVLVWIGRGPTVDALSRTSTAGLVVVHGLVMAGLFYCFRAEAHFLGDGYTVLSSLASETPIIKSREIGESLSHVWARDLLGGPTEAAALASFRVLSIVSGIVYIAAVWWGSVRLFEDRGRQVGAVLLLSSMGWVMLYFGYVEYYSLFVTSLAILGLVGAVAASGKISRWWIVIPAVAAPLLHVLGVVFLPAVVYLLIARSKLGRLSGRLSLSVRVGLAVVGLAGAVGILWYWYSQSVFLRLALVPLAGSRFVVDGYTMFSLRHIADVINLVVMLVPGGLVLMVTVLFGGTREVWKDFGARFLLVLSVCGLAAAFLFDARIGMPRDWDLFSFASVGPGLLAVYVALRWRSRRVAGGVIVLAVAINLFFIAPRVVLINSEERQFAQLEQYVAWDPARGSNTLALVSAYHEKHSDPAIRQQEIFEWSNVHREHDLTRLGLDMLRQGRMREAKATFERVLDINPLFGSAYSNIGNIYLQQGQLDSARWYLTVAQGVNPYSPAVMNNLAWLRLAEGDIDGAEEMLRKAISIDPTEWQFWAGLAETASRRNDSSARMAALREGASKSEPPVPVLVELARHSFGAGDRVSGEQYLQRAVGRGYPQAAADSLRQAARN